MKADTQDRAQEDGQGEEGQEVVPGESGDEDGRHHDVEADDDLVEGDIEAAHGWVVLFALQISSTQPTGQLLRITVKDDFCHLPGAPYIPAMKKPTKAKLRARSEDRIAFAKEMRQAFLDGELDVTYTESGLGYVIHEAGEGIAPKPGKNVEVHYVGILKDKPVVFDESFGNIRGARFVLGSGEVIPGWDEGIALLRWGDEATLFIPSKLGYGPKGRGQGIPSNSDLLFYVEIASVG